MHGEAALEGDATKLVGFTFGWAHGLRDRSGLLGEEPTGPLARPTYASVEWRSTGLIGMKFWGQGQRHASERLPAEGR